VKPPPPPPNLTHPTPPPMITNMLLTITTTQPPATHLAYPLHKHPARRQSFELSFGQAHVFHPEAVGGTARSGAGGDGGQAVGLCGAEPAGIGAAGGEVSRSGIPADHLRTGVHGTGESGAVAFTPAGRQALAGPAGIRSGHRSAGTLRAPRTAVPRPRVRLWCAGPRKRAGRSTPVSSERDSE